MCAEFLVEVYVGVAGESMALTPSSFFENEWDGVCACSPPSVCMEGYNCSFFCDILILLSEGVCALSSRWLWEEEVTVCAAEDNNKTLFEAGTASPPIFWCWGSQQSPYNLVALSMDSDENGVSTVGGVTCKGQGERTISWREATVAIRPEALPVLRTHLFQSNPSSVALCSGCSQRMSLKWMGCVYQTISTHHSWRK